jgi:ribosomal-protein-alanine N-acetyltransferase
MTVLTTKRLTLRRLIADDAAVLHRIHHEPGVWTYFIGQPPATVDQERAYLEAHLAHYSQQGFGFRAMILRETGELIGRCGLLSQVVEGQAETEVAYLLSPRFWGQGLASEAARRIRDHAFETLGCLRLVSLIHPDNHPSKRVALATGMKYVRNVSFKGVDVAQYDIERATRQRFVDHP